MFCESGPDIFKVPIITSVTPATPNTAGGTVVTIAGNNFFDNADGDFSFKVYGQSVVCSTISMQSLICTFPALTTSNFPSNLADRKIMVTNKYYVAGNYFLQYAAPSITSIFPVSGPTGPVVSTGLPTRLTVNGANFGPVGTAVVKVGRLDY